MSQSTPSPFKMSWSLDAQTKLAERFVSEYEGWSKGPKITFHRKWSEELDIEHATADRISVRIKTFVKTYEAARTLKETISQEGQPALPDEEILKRVEKICPLFSILDPVLSRTRMPKEPIPTATTTNSTPRNPIACDTNSVKPTPDTEGVPVRRLKRSSDPAYKTARLVYKRHKLENKRYIAELKHKEKIAALEYKMRKLASQHTAPQQSGAELPPLRPVHYGPGLPYSHGMPTHPGGTNSRRPTMEIISQGTQGPHGTQSQAGMGITRQIHRVSSIEQYGNGNHDAERTWQGPATGWDVPKGGWFQG
ncbi:hypothetical protein BJ508DRAFT_332300 [Ascobolus immersus RN42]|uniref:Uncharacterized protein n=1 Tax=Ascobolus immersus RN42 TaxID=1160509 RepID=A0A3N4HTY3_ASCIM|nr:hypothetical protein BJ508DRAFT_332300 [Ascobolus immersus RN42]